MGSRSSYTNRFKARMVQRMSPPDPERAVDVAADTGVSQSCLSRWLTAAANVAAMKADNKDPPKRPADWTAEERLLIVAKAMAIPDEDLGELLRSEGLHEEQLEEWKAALLDGVKGPTTRSNTQVRKKIRRLEREVQRKDKALAETAALLVLQGKAKALWGDEGNGI